MNNICVVDSNTCKKLQNPTSPFMLVLYRGESIVDTILNCAKQMNIISASLYALGALENPEIAFYDLPTKKYQNKTFPGIYELVSLMGNLTQADGQLTSHMHVTIGDAEHHIFGGHLTGAVVGVTAEITIIPFPKPIQRKFYPEFGIKLIMAD